MNWIKLVAEVSKDAGLVAKLEPVAAQLLALLSQFHAAPTTPGKVSAVASGLALASDQGVTLKELAGLAQAVAQSEG